MADYLCKTKDNGCGFFAFGSMCLKKGGCYHQELIPKKPHCMLHKRYSKTCHECYDLIRKE